MKHALSFLTFNHFLSYVFPDWNFIISYNWPADKLYTLLPLQTTRREGHTVFKKCIISQPNKLPIYNLTLSRSSLCHFSSFGVFSVVMSVSSSSTLSAQFWQGAVYWIFRVFSRFQRLGVCAMRVIAENVCIYSHNSLYHHKPSSWLVEPTSIFIIYHH